MQLVCFFLGEREFGIPIERVKETIELRSITPVFHTPTAVAGITNLRGEILAVLETATLLGLPTASRGDDTRLLVVTAADRRAGLLVDQLGALREIERDAIDQVPAHMPAEVTSMLDGFVALDERPLGVLDVDRLLAAPELASISAPMEEASRESHG